MSKLIDMNETVFFTLILSAYKIGMLMDKTIEDKLTVITILIIALIFRLKNKKRGE